MNSKVLEAFDYITTFSVKGEKICIQDIDKYQANCDIVENALKALEIIKTVAPNVFWIMRTHTYEEYKKKCSDDTLLQEEYKFLKEVLL